MDTFEGRLLKMATELKDPVQYTFLIGDHKVLLNNYLGKKIKMTYSGEIHCINCDRHTNKSFNQGYCFVCFRTLAACDTCIIKPELCHIDKGTCRQPEWGREHCLKPHVVYLANTSGLKVGVTRQKQIPTRWMDQGAVQARPLFQVDQRLHAGRLEDFLKAHIADKTNWRTMLKGSPESQDLNAKAEELLGYVEAEFKDDFMKEFCKDTDVINIQYPVLQYPEKVTSQSFDKKECVEGELLGIKGQYLILDTGVINIRKFGGYVIKAELG